MSSTSIFVASGLSGESIFSSDSCSILRARSWSRRALSAAALRSADVRSSLNLRALKFTPHSMSASGVIDDDDPPRRVDASTDVVL